MRRKRIKVFCLNKNLINSKKANNIARIENAKGFSEDENVEKVVFFGVRRSLKKHKISEEKIKFKEVFIPFYPSKDSLGNNIYKYFFADLLLDIYYFVYCLFRVGKKDFIYVRDANSFYLLFIRFFRKINYVYENHNFEFGKKGLANKFVETIIRKLMRGSLFLVTVSKYTAKFWKEHGIKKEILVYPSGVNWKTFSLAKKTDLRKKLGIGKDSVIIMYTGHLYSWKGANVLFDSISFVKNKKAKFVFVGGYEKDISKYEQMSKEKNYDNVFFLGHVEHSLIPSYLASADVLVLPNTAKERISYYHTSPIKLLEYLAVTKPIIASDLPSIKSLIENKEVEFFEADNEKDLANKIEKVIKNYKKYEEKAKQNNEKYSKHDWKTRTKNIINKAIKQIGK